MTAIARRTSGESIALLVPFAILGVWAVLGAYYAFVRDYGVIEGLSMSFRPIFWMILAATLWKWVHVRQRRGRVLLDAGPLRQRWLFIVTFVSFLIITVISLVLPSAPRGSGGLFAWPLNVSFCALLLIQVLQGRALFTEAGILAYGHLFPWRNVVGYRWYKGGELEIRMQGWSRMHEPLRIPAEKRQAVEELLSQHCPVPQPS